MDHNQDCALHVPAEMVRPVDRKLQHLSICVLLVGMHSLALGLFIFFFTGFFYSLFFGVDVVNFFFVKQAGLFLFCLGLFYLAPLADLNSKHRLVDIIIITKLLAVVFLLRNMWLVPRPMAILLAAVCDAVMATLLIYFSRSAGLLLKKTEKAIT